MNFRFDVLLFFVLFIFLLFSLFFPFSLSKWNIYTITTTTTIKKASLYFALNTKHFIKTLISWKRRNFYLIYIYYVRILFFSHCCWILTLMQFEMRNNKNFFFWVSKCKIFFISKIEAETEWGNFLWKFILKKILGKISHTNTLDFFLLFI